MKNRAIRALWPVKHEGGFTFVSLLFIIIVIGLALGSTGKLWSNIMKRDKEEELIFRAGQIRTAIEKYYKMPGIKGYPQTLNDLLKDKRQPVLTRHLRKIYEDPMTGKADWALIKVHGGGIMGIRSRSGDEPYKKQNFPKELKNLEGKIKYSEWEFVYNPVKKEGG